MSSKLWRQADQGEWTSRPIHPSATFRLGGSQDGENRRGAENQEGEQEGGTEPHTVTSGWGQATRGYLGGQQAPGGLLMINR